MYSPVDGYRCTRTPSRGRRPQCCMAAATAGPMLFRQVDWWQQVRCGTAAAAAGLSDFEQGSFTMLNSCSGERTVAGSSVFEPGSFTMLNSCGGERTVARPSVFEPGSLTMLNSCSGERTVARPSVFELSTFTMSTKYPYSALARNYIVQTSLAWRPPPFCHDVRARQLRIGQSRHAFLPSHMHTALLLVAHSCTPACYWRLMLALAWPLPPTLC